MRFVRSGGLVLALIFALAGRAASPQLRLGTSGERFTVNGTPTFLVFVSDFDVLDSPNPEADFAYLASRVDGVRIFANWWDFGTGPCRLRFSPRTVIGVDPDGHAVVRPDRLARLEAVLDAARAHGLLVDVTFAAEPVQGLSDLAAGADGSVCPITNGTNRVRWQDYAAAVGEVAGALKGDSYAHVLFDLQNEAGHRMNGATDADLQLLVASVRKIDPARLLTVSSFDPDGSHQVAMVKRLGLSALNFHDWPRSAGWGARTGAEVKKFRTALASAGLDVPIYAGEPDAVGYGRGLAEFEASLQGARRAGAAAWTFHTRAGHELESSTLVEALPRDARRFLDEARKLAAAAQ